MTHHKKTGGTILHDHYTTTTHMFQKRDMSWGGEWICEYEKKFSISAALMEDGATAASERAGAG